jgi:lipopolysaccharide transport system ATP-binding protein
MRVKGEKMTDSIFNKDMVVSVQDISKCYLIYNQPQDRLKQILWRGRRKFFKEFWALKNVSLNVKKGEALGIIGRNGSGKSTLLQVISGIIMPTQGTVNIKGRIAALLELGSGFNPEFTGRENVFLNGSILGISRSEMEYRLGDIISFAGIGDFIDQPVKTYSSGMYVRLAFSVQALIEPDVLIVDEALAVGDEKFQRKCYSLIDKLREKGTSVLVVTHSTSLVEKYCQKALLLDRGEVHGFGQPKDIIDQYHALLYADEKAYLKMLNKGKIESDICLPEHEITNENNDSHEVSNQDMQDNNNTKIKAFIEDIWVCDINGNKGELFETGSIMNIYFNIFVMENIKHMLVGIRIKTVEGIEVYGTSTDYMGKSPLDIEGSTRMLFRFKMPLLLCEGSYFISVAVAEKIDSADMQYLDKRSDAVIIKVREAKLTATGIAYLGSDIEYSYEAV